MSDVDMVIHNIDELTLKQLFKAIGKIKIKALIFLGSLFIGYTISIFGLGQAFQQKGTAISLNWPFTMSIDIDSKTHQLNKLILTEDFVIEGADNNKVALKLRKFDENSGGFYKIGQVVAQKAKIRKITIGASLDIVNKSYAQNNFNWYGHKDNFRFYEKFVARDTVRRYYEDGWILEYKLDNIGRPIPSSFRWVKRN